MGAIAVDSPLSQGLMDDTLRLSNPVKGSKDTFAARTDSRNLRPESAQWCGSHINSMLESAVKRQLVSILSLKSWRYMAGRVSSDYSPIKGQFLCVGGKEFGYLFLFSIREQGQVGGGRKLSNLLG